MDRCPECGSWERECVFEMAKDDCGCQRCLRETLARVTAELQDASCVCACGHPDSDHELYGEDGLTHECEHDCVRTSATVRAMLDMLRADLARITTERDALAKRWEALREWSSDGRHEVILTQMRDLEIQYDRS